jgi:hypothetical protein
MDKQALAAKLLPIAQLHDPSNERMTGAAELAGLVHTLLTERANSRRHRIALASLTMRSRAAKESPHNLSNR